MMATGFSAGGMMVWNLVCDRSTLFAGFAPIAGTFWEPMPTSCAAPPASVVHIHGTSDKTVPLLGRPIAGTHQGQVPTALEMYARHGDFSKPVSVTIGGWHVASARTPTATSSSSARIPADISSASSMSRPRGVYW